MFQSFRIIIMITNCHCTADVQKRPGDHKFQLIEIKIRAFQGSVSKHNCSVSLPEKLKFHLDNIQNTFGTISVTKDSFLLSSFLWIIIICPKLICGALLAYEHMHANMYTHTHTEWFQAYIYANFQSLQLFFIS